MRVDLRSVLLGVAFAAVLVGGALALLLTGGPAPRTLAHRVTLPSGKTLDVTMCNFAWGIEHSDRDDAKDGFVLEYVSTVPHSDEAAVDRETLEAFELIRPASEQWGLAGADVGAFPSRVRKGRYLRYHFTRGPDGRWNYDRAAAKVFVND